ncbi:MAG: hypothetical protein AB7L76_17395 [Burkholderiaceae bacterium]
MLLSVLLALAAVRYGRRGARQ